MYWSEDVYFHFDFHWTCGWSLLDHGVFFCGFFGYWNGVGCRFAGQDVDVDTQRYERFYAVDVGCLIVAGFSQHWQSVCYLECYDFDVAGCYSLAGNEGCADGCGCFELVALVEVLGGDGHQVFDG